MYIEKYRLQYVDKGFEVCRYDIYIVKHKIKKIV